jgi:phosphatidylglycerophosphatase GEP4
MNLNLSGAFNVFRLFAKPTLCLPHATVSTFADLPVPLTRAFEGQGKKIEIKAVVLDKDDCFAYPESNDIHPPNLVRQWIYFVATSLGDSNLLLFTIRPVQKG